MNLGLSAEQQELVGSFTNLFAKSASSERVRAVEPSGFDPALWQTLVDTGAVQMAVPEAAGGWGASLEDLALVAERFGRVAAPAPLVDAQVAARLVAATESGPAANALARVLDGDEVVTLAVRTLRDREARLAPAGAVCNAMVAFDGENLLLTRVTDVDRTAVANLASAPLADVRVRDDAAVIASGPAAAARFERAIDEWLTLTASAVVGLAQTAHDLACSYAAERIAFGAPIGSFQGVAHPLADDATNLDGARLLAQKAAWALDADDARGRELAAMAFAFAVRAGEVATYNALHFHGGYGFMLEYDVQLFYRRVRGWSRVWGSAADASARAADARYGARVR
ncbi:MAG: hypothetical protein QOJ00_243 [Actinomycetota bacterium]